MAARYLGAVGIAVNDLEASTTFYTELLGLVEMQRFEFPGITQLVLGFEGVRSAALLLRKHTGADQPVCKNLPVKLVFYLPDVRATLSQAHERNLIVERDAAAEPSMGGAIIGIIKDPDGYLVELIQKPPKP